MLLFNVWYKLKNSIMNSLKTVKILLSPLRLHSASSIQIPQSTNRYNSMLPSVYVSPLKLHSATKINLHGVSDSALFRNHLKVRLSPLKVSKVAKIRNRYNQVPHLTQDTNGKVTNSQKTPQTRAKRSALSQQVTTKHI